VKSSIDIVRRVHVCELARAGLVVALQQQRFAATANASSRRRPPYRRWPPDGPLEGTSIQPDTTPPFAQATRGGRKAGRPRPVVCPVGGRPRPPTSYTEGSRRRRCACRHPRRHRVLDAAPRAPFQGSPVTDGRRRRRGATRDLHGRPHPSPPTTSTGDTVRTSTDVDTRRSMMRSSR
jgi:hypothetical protein